MAEGYLESELRKGYFVIEFEENVIKKDERPLSQQPNFSEIKPDIKIDFNHGDVDLEYFPFSVWRKLLVNTSQPQQHKLFMNGSPQDILISKVPLE